MLTIIKNGLLDLYLKKLPTLSDSHIADKQWMQEISSEYDIYESLCSIKRDAPIATSYLADNPYGA